MCWTFEYFAFPQNLLFERLMYSASSLVVTLQKAMKVNPTTWAAAPAPPCLWVETPKIWFARSDLRLGLKSFYGWLCLCVVLRQNLAVYHILQLWCPQHWYFHPLSLYVLHVLPPIPWVPGRYQRVVLIVCNVNKGMTEKIARVTLSWRQAVLTLSYSELATCECHGRDAGLLSTHCQSKGKRSLEISQYFVSVNYGSLVSLSL